MKSVNELEKELDAAEREIRAILDKGNVYIDADYDERVLTLGVCERKPNGDFYNLEREVVFNEYPAEE